MENEKQREYFEEILILRNRIKSLDDQVQNMKNEELKSFKRRYESFKNSNAANSMQYDLIFSALFGNSITL
jgi:hypothetical protein